MKINKKNKLYMGAGIFGLSLILIAAGIFMVKGEDKAGNTKINNASQEKIENLTNRMEELEVKVNELEAILLFEEEFEEEMENIEVSDDEMKELEQQVLEAQEENKDEMDEEFDEEVVKEDEK